MLVDKRVIIAISSGVLKYNAKAGSKALNELKKSNPDFSLIQTELQAIIKTTGDLKKVILEAKKTQSVINKFSKSKK